MNETKTWKLTPAKKPKYLLLTCLISIVLFLLIKTQSFWYILILIILALSSIPRPALFIKTSDEEIELSVGDIREKIYWADIVEYFHSAFNIILKLSNGSSVSVDINSLENRDEFITYLNEKLKHLSLTECLNCGFLIDAEDDKCPSCGWTWKV